MPGSTDGSTKTMGGLTIGGLVVVTAYTVALLKASIADLKKK